MSSLNQRAEQALIGALLSDYTVNQMPYVAAPDFSHPGYRSVYTAIRDLHQTEPDLQGDALVAKVAADAKAPGLGEQQLRQLRDDCPDPDHLTAYARMVKAASFKRQITAHAENFTQAAIRGEGDPALNKLAETLTRQTELWARMDQQISQVARQSSEPNQARQQAEDDILATALQYPEQAQILARAIPVETFTSQQRRDIFETTVSLAASGDPVDEVIVAWELDRVDYVSQLTSGKSGPQPVSTYPEPNTTYLARLADREVNPDTAIRTGRDLVTRDVTAKLKQHAARVSTTPSPPAPKPVAQPRPETRPTLQPPPAPEPGNGPQPNPGRGA